MDRRIVFVVNTGAPDAYERVGNQGIALTNGSQTTFVPFPRDASRVDIWIDWMCRNFNLERKS